VWFSLGENDEKAYRLPDFLQRSTGREQRCATFFEESRMQFGSSIDIYRKSGFGLHQLRNCLGGLGPVGNAIDLHFHAGGYHARCDRSTGGLVGSEDFGIHLIHGAKILRVTQEDGAFDDILQIRAAASQDGLHMLQHEPGLLLHGSLRLHLAGRGIYRALTGDKQKIACAHCA
jgi:hypothetical protein